MSSSEPEQTGVLSVVVPKATKDEFTRLASRRERSASQQARLLIREFIASEQAAEAEEAASTTRGVA